MRTRKLPQRTAAVSSATESTTYSSDSVLDRYVTDRESTSRDQSEHSKSPGDDVGITSACSPPDGTLRVLLSCRFDECERLFETVELVDQHMLDCPHRPITWPPPTSSLNSLNSSSPEFRPIRSTRKPTARYEEYTATVSKKTKSSSAGIDAARKISAQSRKLANNSRRTKATNEWGWKKRRRKKRRSPPIADATKKAAVVYLCLYCPFESVDRMLYLRHRRRHALFSQQTCSMCSYAVSSAKSHAETAATLCVHCSLHFKPTREQALATRLPPIFPCADHLHIEKNVASIPTRCNYCRRWFSDEAACRTHESHHTGFLLPVVKQPQTLEKREESSDVYYPENSGAAV